MPGQTNTDAEDMLSFSLGLDIASHDNTPEGIEALPIAYTAMVQRKVAGDDPFLGPRR